MSELPGSVLFACTHNAIRSAMAENIMRFLHGRKVYVQSAGIRPGELDPFAVAVMDEIGIDISGHVSTTIEPFLGQAFSWLITVCDDAKESCPTIPGAAKQAHWSINDPSAVEGDEEARLAAFREVRDILRDRIHIFILAAGRDDLPNPEPQSVGPAPD